MYRRELGEPDKSEFTVVKAEAYSGINAYLLDLEGSEIKCLEDVVAYNEKNSATEGAHPGDHPAFASGQDNFEEIVKCKGLKDATYGKALDYIRRKSQEEGINAALRYRRDDGKIDELDALLMCDKKAVGQQIAAQAGKRVNH